MKTTNPVRRLAWRVARLTREALHLQMLIALESGDTEVLVGGQAVMEGVMMCAPHSYAVAVRRADGTITTTSRTKVPAAERNKIWSWPMLRGLATLGQAMTLGVRALRFSSDQFLPAPDPAAAVKPGKAPGEVSQWGMMASLVFSLLFFVGFYKFVPLLAATALQRHYHAMSGQIMFNLADGLIRLALFLAFMGGLALLPDIRRIFQYHGAEHKVVFNFESGQPVDLDHARPFTTLHPRCGTSFMIVIMLIAMVVYMAIPVHTFGMRLLVRVGMLPIIAGLSYEIIRYGAKHNSSVFAMLARPGLWLQRITTQEPSDAQLECSILSLQRAMDLEKIQGGSLVIS